MTRHRPFRWRSLWQMWWLSVAGGLWPGPVAAQLPAPTGQYQWLLRSDNEELGQPVEEQQISQVIELRRQLVRHYTVPAAGRPFTLDSRYGRVQVHAWARPEIRVEAEMVARAGTVPAARQLLAALGVQWLDYEVRTGGVAVQSQFGAGLGGRAAGAQYAVNYQVWLPATTDLTVRLAFGELALENDWRGPTDLTVEYGSLRTARLLSARNAVRIGNGECLIPYARQASLDARYARLRLDVGETVTLRTNYTDVEVGTVQDLTLHSKYGDVALGTVGSLRGASGYARFRVRRLDEDLDMALHYCPSFVVSDTGPEFRQITLDGGYSTIQLGFAETPGFRFDVSTEQGQLLVDKAQVRVLREARSAQGRDVLGVFGPAPPARNAGSVNVRVRYGTVQFSR